MHTVCLKSGFRQETIGGINLPNALYFITVPTASPRSPSGTAISTTLITLTWTPPPAIDINGEIRFYLVEVTEVITGRMFTFHAVDTFINIGPLRAGNLYSCRVAAFTIALGPFTARFTVRSVETGKYGSTNMSVWITAIRILMLASVRVITLRVF